MKLKPGEKAILPPWFKAGIVAALVVTIVASWTYRLDGQTHVDVADAASHGKILKQTDLHFIDLKEGSVSIVDATTKLEITRLYTGEDGFMRSVMRGMVRERKAHGLGPEVPFQLTLWEDGLVSLIDPATKRRVELSAFGIDNVAAFTRLLPLDGITHSPAS